MLLFLKLHFKPEHIHNKRLPVLSTQSSHLLAGDIFPQTGLVLGQQVAEALCLAVNP